MNAVKYYRLKAQLSQSQLGAMLNKHIKTISCWERGETPIDEENAKNIATIFECDFNLFVGRNPQINGIALPHLKNFPSQLTKMQQLFLTMKLTHQK